MRQAQESTSMSSDTEREGRREDEARAIIEDVREYLREGDFRDRETGILREGVGAATHLLDRCERHLGGRSRFRLEETVEEEDWAPPAVRARRKYTSEGPPPLDDAPCGISDIWVDGEKVDLDDPMVAETVRRGVVSLLPIPPRHGVRFDEAPSPLEYVRRAFPPGWRARDGAYKISIPPPTRMSDAHLARGLGCPHCEAPPEHIQPAVGGESFCYDCKSTITPDDIPDRYLHHWTTRYLRHPSIPSPSGVTAVHYFRPTTGPACQFSTDLPGDWPEGHLWTNDPDDVTCLECLESGTCVPPKLAGTNPAFVVFDDPHGEWNEVVIELTAGGSAPIDLTGVQMPDGVTVEGDPASGRIRVADYMAGDRFERVDDELLRVRP